MGQLNLLISIETDLSDAWIFFKIYLNISNYISIEKLILQFKKLAFISM